MTNVAFKPKLMFSCEVIQALPSYWVAIRHVVAYYAQGALAFSAGIKFRHCSHAIYDTSFAHYVTIGHTAVKITEH